MCGSSNHYGLLCLVIVHVVEHKILIVIYPHGIVHPWSEDSCVVVSKLQVNGAVDQPEGVAVGNLSATTTLLHLRNQLDGGTDTERVVAIPNSVTVGIGWNPDRVATVHLKPIPKCHVPVHACTCTCACS